ncbi:MAG: signal recognition particle protein, partial [Polyangiales bacterium]
QNALLVVDAMIGQDAVSTAAAFHDRLGLTGVVLTKLDGDARGGAALSVKAVTGAPIKFVGMGEDLERLETFRPEGMASRILGFGDVVGLMRDFEGVVDEQKAEADTERMLKGQFTLDDFVEQIDILQRLGPLQDVMEKLPFFSDSVPAGFQVDERELTRTKAMVCSMTPDERRRIDLFQRQPSRLRRVAKGAGRSEKEVTDLIQRFAFMKQMMGEIGTQAGMLGKIPGMKQLAMTNRLRDAVQSSGLEDNPMLANLADSLLEAAVAGQGGQASAQAAGRRKVLSPAKKKSRQKMQKKSRRKSRR